MSTKVSETEVAAHPQGGGSSEKLRRRSPVQYLRAGLLLCVGYLVVFPILQLVINAFRDQPLYLPGGRWSLEWWSVILLAPGTLGLVLNTSIFVATALVVGFTLSVPSAWILERTDVRGARVWRSTIISTMALAPGVVAFSWTLLAEPRMGALTLLVRDVPLIGNYIGLNIQTLTGMGLVGGLVMTPTVYTILAPNLRMIGGELEEASYTSGVGTTETAWRIVVPLVRPALMGAFIIMAIIMLGTLEIPHIIGQVQGLNVFANRIYHHVRPPTGLANHNAAAVLGLILLVISILLVTLYYKVHSRANQYAVITARSYRRRLLRLGKWQVLAQAYLLFVVMLILVLPASILLWTSLLPFYRPPTATGAWTGMTLDAYTFSGVRGVGSMLRNTALVTVLGATATMVLGLAVGWCVTRSRGASARALNVLTFSPTGIPTILIAAAVFMAYLYLPLPLTGTIWILILAYMTNYVAYGMIFMRAAVGQLHDDLEEASLMSGAGLARTFGRITGPLIAPAFIAGWMWVASRVMRDMTIAPVLQSPDNTVIGSFLWQRFQDGNMPGFSAVALMMVLVLFVIVFLAQRTERRR